MSPSTKGGKGGAQTDRLQTPLSPLNLSKQQTSAAMTAEEPARRPEQDKNYNSLQRKNTILNTLNKQAKAMSTNAKQVLKIRQE